MMRTGSIVFALGMLLLVAVTACDAPAAPIAAAVSAPHSQSLPQLVVFHSPL